MQVHILTIKAGHAFDEVKRKEAFSDKMVGEAWGEATCDELRQAAIAEDPSFEYGYNFFYSTQSFEIDQALETK